jgi:hypothetical protein
MSQEMKSDMGKGERFIKAKQNLERIQKTIAPFIKRRDFKQHSTEGEWREESSSTCKHWQS